MGSDNRNAGGISPRQIPQELFDKYSKSGPRYTSYPTAPQFKTEFDSEEIRSRWQKSNESGNGLSLYLHVPFCRKRCLYCGCHTEIGHREDVAKAYVNALLGEADRMVQLVDGGRPLMQLALGGGTPTFLGPDAMSTLVNGLKERFNFVAEGERSIEVDPRSVDLEYLDVLCGLGFNRFSFGVQDLNANVQKAIGRVCPEEVIAERLSHLRSKGHHALNIDLIYGLPLQTPDSFGETIERAIRLEPSRVALFGYAHVPWVSPHQQALERHGIPDANERMELFGIGFEKFTGAGYSLIGMDHFAREGDELVQALHNRSLTRNFMGYTTRRGLDLIGLGASSISSVGGTYTQNIKPVKEYLDQAGEETWVKGLVMTAEDFLRGEVILELMCNCYVDIPAIEDKYQINFSEHFADALTELAELQADGLVEAAPQHIAITEMGRFFMRNISMPFDEYLKKETTTGRYSKTV
ncbi:MAG TPA: oxygen-independent coproporphyrinogen III oxidase [Firmicutes bacterium]|nr:oxygen-independent coproporphyrinogen III oxidase [Bacillota bacterium]